MGLVRWQCLLHRGTLWCGDIWADYGAPEAGIIERHWQSFQLDQDTPTVILEHANWAHEVDFSMMTQTSLDTGSARPIRRIMIMAF